MHLQKSVQTLGFTSICDGSLVGNEKNGGVSVSGRNDAGLKGKGIGEA